MVAGAFLELADFFPANSKKIPAASTGSGSWPGPPLVNLGSTPGKAGGREVQRISRRFGMRRTPRPRKLRPRTAWASAQPEPSASESRDIAGPMLGTRGKFVKT